ncbi:MAG: serine/threonine protein kinase [Deltaproteobacteria bacterium]|nr:serine/threonine protein kinase [Deltaproteobacteria bacterium]
MRACLACSMSVNESGRFCPQCGAVLAEVGRPVDEEDAGTAETHHGSDSKTAASLVGRTVDGFAIEGILGGGAFGTVYRGRQTGLDRLVAIKVPTYEIAADAVMSKRFAREAKAAARIHHPGVVTIHAVGELPDGRPYMAMQLVEGKPLDDILEDTKTVPVDRALDIARQIASALSDTHAVGVVHRDLKPTNIMWQRDRNGDDRITLVDFGIAVCKLGGGSSDVTRLTQNGLIGTPHYMSPEQAHGETVDARSDIYALGCLLFELVTGEPPYDGSGFEVLLAHLGRPAPVPSERNPNLPPVIDRLIGHLMAKKPDERPQSADAVVQMIDEALERLGAPAAGSARRRKGTVTSSGERDAAEARVKRAPTAPPLAKKGDERRSTSYDAAYAEPSSTKLPVPPAVTAAMRARWAMLGAVIGLAVAVAGVGAFRLIRSKPSTAAPAAASGADLSDADNNHAKETPKVLQDGGEVRLKAWWRDDQIVAGKQGRLHLDLRNKLGAPIGAEQLIVTIEDPTGKATGTAARPRRNVPDQYNLTVKFTDPGRYVVHIFPPETDTSFDFTLDVPAATPPR